MVMKCRTWSCQFGKKYKNGDEGESLPLSESSRDDLALSCMFCSITSVEESSDLFQSNESIICGISESDDGTCK